jgi:hypothetical protein
MRSKERLVELAIETVRGSMLDKTGGPIDVM